MKYKNNNFIFIIKLDQLLLLIHNHKLYQNNIQIINNQNLKIINNKQNKFIKNKSKFIINKSKLKIVLIIQ
jgi:hypothetical protein